MAKKKAESEKSEKEKAPKKAARKSSAGKTTTPAAKTRSTKATAKKSAVKAAKKAIAKAVKKVTGKTTKKSTAKASRAITPKTMTPKPKAAKKATTGTTTRRKKAAAPTVVEMEPVYEEAVPTEPVSTNHRDSHPRAQLPAELPNEYGQTRLVILPRDPDWLFAYWEITHDIRSALGLIRNQHDKRMVIRMYDVTGVGEFDGFNANDLFDIDINDYAESWYIRTNRPSRHWCADLGLITEGGEFVQIVRSNRVISPSDSISHDVDEEWMIPEEEAERIYGLSKQALRQLSSGSEAVGLAPGIQPGALERLFPGASEQLFSAASAIRPLPKVSEFGLWVETELILYGGTYADAEVTIQGQRVEVRPDGTFSQRFALPPGQQVIDVEAISADRDHQRRIVTKVKKSVE